MAARAYWRGQIRLALVSIPVEIFSATKSGAQIAFNQIHEPSGKRIKYEKVVPGIGPVDPEDIVKGYQVEKGTYVTMTDEELEAVKLESKRTLDLTQFVDYDEVDVLYFEKPALQYWLGALGFKVFGITEFAARLWPGVAGYATVLMVGYTAGRLWGRDVGIRALAICASMTWIIGIGAVGDYFDILNTTGAYTAPKQLLFDVRAGQTGFTSTLSTAQVTNGTDANNMTVQLDGEWREGHRCFAR